MNVGKRVVERRTTLGMNQRDLAMRADVTPATLRSLEQDRRWPQDVNRAKIEQALGWAPGSLEAIRDGGEPTELADDEPSQSGSILSGPSGPLPTGRSQPGASAFSESDQQRLLRGANAVGNALNNPADPANLSRIRASFRENIGRHGVTPDLVRTVAAGHLSAVVSQLDARRRDQVVELAYQLLDEQESEGGGGAAVGVDKPADDLAARRDSNSRGRPILGPVDDDDPTAGVDWRDYAAHPATEPLEEDNPTP